MVIFVSFHQNKLKSTGYLKFSEAPNSFDLLLTQLWILYHSSNLLISCSSIGCCTLFPFRYGAHTSANHYTTIIQRCNHSLSVLCKVYIVWPISEFGKWTLSWGVNTRSFWAGKVSYNHFCFFMSAKLVFLLIPLQLYV